MTPFLCYNTEVGLVTAEIDKRGDVKASDINTIGAFLYKDFLFCFDRISLIQ